MGHVASSMSSSSSSSTRPGPVPPSSRGDPLASTANHDPVFHAVYQYYLRGESLAALSNDDRLLRSDEGAENYGVGGYLSVHRGQLYNKRYMIVSKLGWGHFSTVWLGADLTTFRGVERGLGPPCRHVALKFQKGEASYLEAAVDEVKLLRRVADVAGAMQPTQVPVAHMCDSFRVVGPSGKHMCTVFEVLGDNLLLLLKRCPNRRLPLGSVQLIARDVLRGLDFLHRHCHIIHTDLKPENVLLAGTDPRLAMALATGRGLERIYRQEGQACPAPVVKIADLGNACWTNHHFTDYITTRQYRSPEIILKAPYNCATDLWSLGCLCFELITGDYLFDPKANCSEGYSRNDDHLALMIELMGPPPSSLIKGAASSRYFDSSGRLVRLPSLDHWPLHDVLVEKHNFPRQEAVEIAAFLRPMLQLDPGRRVTAQQHLRHPWLRSDVPARPDSVVLNMQHRDVKTPALSPTESRSLRQQQGAAPPTHLRRTLMVPRFDAVPAPKAAHRATMGTWRGTTLVAAAASGRASTRASHFGG